MPPFVPAKMRDTPSAESSSPNYLPPQQDVGIGSGMDIFSPRPDQHFSALGPLIPTLPTIEDKRRPRISPAVSNTHEKPSSRAQPPRIDNETCERDVIEAQPPMSVTSGHTLDVPYSNRTNFTFIKNLGKGTEGRITLVKHRGSPVIYALKTVIKPDLIDRVPHEAAVLHALNLNRQPHPHIIHIEAFAFLMDLVTPYAEYYLPYYPLGDLHSLTHGYASRSVHIPELFIWQVFYDLASALEYLHRGFYDKRPNANPGVVHRDIKPGNILLRHAKFSSSDISTSHLIPFPEVVVSDFGHATFTEFTYDPCGTNIFHGPEIPRSSPKGDVWSMGAVIHYMVHNYAPIGALPGCLALTKENCRIWESRPEARQPKLRLPRIYSQDLARLMGLSLLEEGRRPYAEFIRREVSRAKAMVRARVGKKVEGLVRWEFAA